MKPEIIVGIIAAVSGLLTTALGWLLNQLGIARQLKELEVLKSRLEVVDRLSKVEQISSNLESEIQKMRNLEIRAVIAEIKDITQIKSTDKGDLKNMSWFKRLILGYPQLSLKGRIYKGLFVSFVLFAFLGSLSIISYEKGAENQWSMVLTGALVYIFFGIIFRRLAVRTYERDKSKLMESKNED